MNQNKSKVKKSTPPANPQDFFARTGVEYSVFLKALKGKTGLTKNQWDAVALYFGVTIDELLGKNATLKNADEIKRQNKPWQIFTIAATILASLLLLITFSTWNADFPFSIGKYLRDSFLYNIPYLTRLLYGYLSFSGVTILVGILSFTLKY